MGETLREDGWFGMPAWRLIPVLLTVLAITPGCATATQSPRALDAPALDAAITRVMSESGIPGVIVGIWSPEGDYVKAFGVADTATGAPTRTDDYSRIGSVTKTFTATAVLQLVDQRRVGLDDPVSKYVDRVPRGGDITVRQLATMRSGLPDYQENPEFAEAVMADPTREFTPAELLGWAFTDSTGVKPAKFAPGQGYYYSNTNYVLLGLVIEKVSGRRLPEYLSRNIFTPLGLAHTSFPTGTEFPDPHPQGYTDPLDADGPAVNATNWSASFTGAAGAIISTLDDIRIWLRALTEGSLISRSLQEQRLQSPPAPGLPDGIGYGMGVMIADGWIGHNGSVPGYQTVAVHLPQRKTTLVIMANTDITGPSGQLPSTALGKAITTVLTPDHIYDV